MCALQQMVTDVVQDSFPLLSLMSLYRKWSQVAHRSNWVWPREFTNFRVSPRSLFSWIWMAQELLMAQQIFLSELIHWCRMTRLGAIAKEAWKHCFLTKHTSWHVHQWKLSRNKSVLPPSCASSVQATSCFKQIALFLSSLYLNVCSFLLWWKQDIQFLWYCVKQHNFIVTVNDCEKVRQYIHVASCPLTQRLPVKNLH